MSATDRVVRSKSRMPRRASSRAIERLTPDCDMSSASPAAAKLPLSTIAVNYGGGPVGVETLAAALSEPRDAIEDIIEPYLIQCGLLQRTPRGRLITAHAFRHLGLPEPARDPTQFGLFGAEEEP